MKTFKVTIKRTTNDETVEVKPVEVLVTAEGVYEARKIIRKEHPGHTIERLQIYPKRLLNK